MTDRTNSDEQPEEHTEIHHVEILMPTGLPPLEFMKALNLLSKVIGSMPIELAKKNPTISLRLAVSCEDGVLKLTPSVSADTLFTEDDISEDK